MCVICVEAREWLNWVFSVHLVVQGIRLRFDEALGTFIICSAISLVPVNLISLKVKFYEV